jgi:hypothetical protein
MESEIDSPYSLNVTCWHFSDIAAAPLDVRYQGHSAIGISGPSGPLLTRCGLKFS